MEPRVSVRAPWNFSSWWPTFHQIASMMNTSTYCRNRLCSECKEVLTDRWKGSESQSFKTQLQGKFNYRLDGTFNLSTCTNWQLQSSPLSACSICPIIHSALALWTACAKCQSRHFWTPSAKEIAKNHLLDEVGLQPDSLLANVFSTHSVTILYICSFIRQKAPPCRLT